MLRAGFSSILALALCAGGLLGAEIQGKLKGVDAEKGTVTVTVDDKDRVFTVTDDTKIIVNDIRAYEPKERLKDPVFKRPNLRVVVRTQTKGGKEVVTQVVVSTGRKG
jgi:hypothetical protein